MRRVELLSNIFADINQLHIHNSEPLSFKSGYHLSDQTSLYSVRFNNYQRSFFCYHFLSEPLRSFDILCSPPKLSGVPLQFQLVYSAFRAAEVIHRAIVSYEGDSSSWDYIFATEAAFLQAEHTNHLGIISL